MNSRIVGLAVLLSLPSFASYAAAEELAEERQSPLCDNIHVVSDVWREIDEWVGGDGTKGEVVVFVTDGGMSGSKFHGDELWGGLCAVVNMLLSCLEQSAFPDRCVAGFP